MIFSILLIIPLLIILSGPVKARKRVTAKGLADCLIPDCGLENTESGLLSADGEEEENISSEEEEERIHSAEREESIPSNKEESIHEVVENAPLEKPLVLPKVSIVAYVQRDEDNLPGYIDTLMSQNYPEKELILVCDASAEATKMLSEKFENHPGLHITFIPPGSHNLSRRKLAQTIGIKRASGEIVLLTSTAVIPVSTEWVGLMMQPFLKSDGAHCAACLGYIRTPLRDFDGITKWYRQFDNVTSATRWMNAVLTDNPYRGDGFNMAFRRELFFANKGYASTISLMDGDDDIFVAEIAKKGSIQLQLNPEGFLQTCWEEHTDRLTTDMKERYAFTKRFLPQKAFYRQTLYAWSRWAMLILSLCALGCGLTGLFEALGRLDINATMPFIADTTGFIPHGLPLSIATLSLGFLIPLWGALMEIISYRKVAATLQAVRLFWATIPFLLWQPVGNFLFNINHRSTRKSHFTWQR